MRIQYSIGRNEKPLCANVHTSSVLWSGRTISMLSLYLNWMLPSINVKANIVLFRIDRADTTAGLNEMSSSLCSLARCYSKWGQVKKGQRKVLTRVGTPDVDFFFTVRWSKDAESLSWSSFCSSHLQITLLACWYWWEGSRRTADCGGVTVKIAMIMCSVGSLVPCSGARGTSSK